jgi:hypothetical protein
MQSVANSGQIRVRMPNALHEQLAETAAKEGVSLNTLIVTLLAGGIGFKVAKTRRRSPRKPAAGQSTGAQSEINA